MKGKIGDPREQLSPMRDSYALPMSLQRCRMYMQLVAGQKRQSGGFCSCTDAAIPQKFRDVPPLLAGG